MMTRSAPHVKRTILLSPLLVGAAALLGACGEAGTATTSTVLGLGTTNYHTLAPTESTSTTTTIPGASTPGQTTSDVTEYTIQAGDVPVNVAKQFGVTLDALNLANADTAGYSSFYVGLVIKIPAGAVIPDPNTTTTVAGATPSQTTTTIAGGGDNCAAGSYVIVEGDIPSAVAKKFDVTLEQLNAANVNTPGYSAFIVGVTIVIPPKADC